MNKGMKYILGFVAIFIAAVVCVFGIIKYEEMQDGSSTNNSANLGSVDGKNLDKETTVVVEKIRTITDLDSLKSELNLSQETIAELKNFAPTVSYSVDSSNGGTKIYLRQGGHISNNKIVGKNELIGAYDVKDGKLTPISENLKKISSKIDSSKLKWTDLNLKNTDHNKSAAKEILRKYFFVTHGGRKLGPVVLFGYLVDIDKNVTVSGKDYHVTKMSLAELTDVYNTAYKDTYSAEDVYKDVPSLKNIKYREVDDSYSGNEDKYNNSLVLGETVFFKKDKVYITGMGGIGGATQFTPTDESSWTTEGDRLIVPIKNSSSNSVAGKYILRLNDKQYKGGESRSKYYIESIELN